MHLSYQANLTMWAGIRRWPVCACACACVRTCWGVSWLHLFVVFSQRSISGTLPFLAAPCGAGSSGTTAVSSAALVSPKWFTHRYENSTCQGAHVPMDAPCTESKLSIWTSGEEAAHVIWIVMILLCCSKWSDGAFHLNNTTYFNYTF